MQLILHSPLPCIGISFYSMSIGTHSLSFLTLPKDFQFLNICNTSLYTATVFIYFQCNVELSYLFVYILMPHLCFILRAFTF